MLLEESIWIRNNIAKYLKEENFPLLNIGSSTGNFRKIVQPHIFQNIFQPLETNRRKVIHLDMKKEEGVDMVGDLSEEVFRNSFKEKAIKSILCSNLLEHLENPVPICHSILDLLEARGVIIVTVPHSFPFHNDPIDTLFRPDVDELHKLFPGTKIKESAIVISTSSYWKDLMANKKYFSIMLARLFLPFYKHREWKFIMQDFMNAKREYSATCLLLEKE